MQGCKGISVSASSSFTVRVLDIASDIAKTLIVILRLAAIHIPLRLCSLFCALTLFQREMCSPVALIAVRAQPTPSLIASQPTDIATPLMRPVHSILVATLGEGLTVSEQSTALGPPSARCHSYKLSRPLCPLRSIRRM